MIRFAADENFNAHIISGLLERDETIDAVRVQDVGHSSSDDPSVLEWAAEEDRVLLTHDIATMPGFTADRLEAGLPMPGLFLISQSRAIGDVIEELLLIADYSLDDEWDGKITYLPLR